MVFGEVLKFSYAQGNFTGATTLVSQRAASQASSNCHASSCLKSIPNGIKVAAVLKENLFHQQRLPLKVICSHPVVQNCHIIVPKCDFPADQ